MRRIGAALVLLLAACGGGSAEGGTASGSTTPAAPGVPTTTDVMVIQDPSALGPLAAQLPEGLDLEGRVLLLVGGWLPDHAANVLVVDPTSAPVMFAGGVVSGAAATPTYERVVASVTEGVLSIAFEHDVNADGWCCSGIQMPEDERCSGLPPLPARATGDPLYVHLIVVPASLVPTMQVARTTSICVRP